MTKFYANGLMWTVSSAKSAPVWRFLAAKAEGKRGGAMRAMFFFVLGAMAVPAHAHVAPGGEPVGFAAGFAHPCSGLDHVLAMLAVGVWAAQLGRMANWTVPLAFVTAMAAGAGLGLAGVPLIRPETGIGVSALVLGLLVAMAVRMRLRHGLVLVGAFGVFHGYAHGIEMPPAASLPLYAAGFLLATGLLHSCGLAAGKLLRDRAALLRMCGTAAALAGIWLVAAAI